MHNFATHIYITYTNVLFFCVVFAILYRFLHSTHCCRILHFIGCACVVLIYILQYSTIDIEFMLDYANAFVKPSNFKSILRMPHTTNHTISFVLLAMPADFFLLLLNLLKFKLICFLFIWFHAILSFPSICAVDKATCWTNKLNTSKWRQSISNQTIPNETIEWTSFTWANQNFEIFCIYFNDFNRL